MKTLIPWAVILALNSNIAFADEGPAEATVSTSGTSAVSSKLSVGYKLVYCTAATHYRTGGSSVTAVTTDLTIPATTAWQLYVGGNELYIAFILDSSTGSCSIHKQGYGPNGGPPPAHASVNGATITPGSIVTSSVNGTGGALNVGTSTPSIGLGMTGGDILVEANLTMDGTTITPLTSAGNITTAATSTPIIGCTGAATCNFTSTTSQNANFDCGGGTCTAQLGASASTAVVGRSGGTSNIAGTVTLTNDNLAASTKTRGTCNLNNGSPSTCTATVNSGSICVCANNTTTTNDVKCSVSSTTLTVTGPNTVTDTVSYICLQ